MKKKTIYKMLAMTVLSVNSFFLANIFALANDSYIGEANNKNGEGSQNTYGTCSTCKYTTMYDRTYSTFVVTDQNGNAKEYTICSSSAAANGAVKCDTIDDNFESPLKSNNGHTNTDYRPAVDEWLNGIIVDGKLNSKHPGAMIVAQTYCGDFDGKTISSSCANIISDTIADKGEDFIDVNVYPGIIIKDSTTGVSIAVDSYNDNLCSGKYPGVNELLCKDLSVACKAGTSTKYSTSNGNSIKPGTDGVCTWDSKDTLTTVGDSNCLSQCKSMCSRITSQNASACVKSCQTARAGTDDSCPPLNETCEEQCQRLYSDNEAAASACIKGKCGNTNLTCEQKCEQSLAGNTEAIKSCKKTSCDSNSTCKTSEPYIPCTTVNCNYTPITYQPSESGGGCGTTQNLSIYQVIGNYCNLATIYNHIQVSIKYPSQINQIIYAGQGFNSNNKFSGTVTETKFVSDIGAISNAIVVQEENKKALESQMKIAVEKAICSANEKYAECTANREKAQEACKSGCKAENPDDCDCSNAGPVCTEVNETEIRKNIEEGYKDRLANIDNEIDNLKTCENSARSYTSTSTSRTISTAHSYMTIGQYTQDAFSIKAVDKSSGMPLTTRTNNSVAETSEFYVPNTVASGSVGTLNATTTVTYGGTSHQFSSTCPFNVSNEIHCPPGGCGDGSSLNLIYRSISLVNPFPNVNDINSNNRETKGFWNDATADIFIKNNREVSNYEVYNLTPMYTITLTPSTIKEIRDYNAGKGNYSGNKHDYSDFNLDCTDGLYCKSEFLRETFNNIIDSSKSCAIGDDWYACDSQKLANTRDSLLDYLR